MLPDLCSLTKYSCMASITVTTNLPEILTSLGLQLKTLMDKNYLLRPVAIETIPNMTQRIHQEGKASDGSQIGTYSNPYLKQRVNNYKRSADTKIIVSLTRQLENNWSVLETSNGYGIGFTNPFNADKLRWVEEGKGKVISELTTAELDYAFERILELTANAFNQ
jgi:hypothetical protein